ncbi:MAG TPA: hypothetical protein VMU22_02315 [Rhizomicrobium sp.]|nr:hypothetical protein [Rhizomicrobium sp.]
MNAEPLQLVGAVSIAALVLVLAETARADNMSDFYGNTVVCTYPNGEVTKVYVESGGRFTVVRGGQTIAGTWSDDGANVCYTETNPAPPAGSKPICLASKAWKVGDGWQVTNPKGDTCNAVLTAGHQ